MPLVDTLRGLGVAMGSVYQGQHLGWTTDEDLAMQCRDAGARAWAGYNTVGPCGWEIFCPVEETEA